MSGLRAALALLTRIPTRSGPDTEHAVPWLPVVGAAVGGVVAGVYIGLRGATTPLVAATIAVAVGVLITGALHEDGIADVADAFGARGDRIRTLEILKDPRHGTFGVLALVLTVVARAAAIGSLGAWSALAAIPAAHALSRAGAASLMWLLPAATPSGLGATYSAPVTRGRVAAGAVAAVVIAGALLGWWTVPAVAIVILAAALMGALALHKIDGITGDVLGAAQQLGEIGVLVLAAAAAGRIPWWHA